MSTTVKVTAGLIPPLDYNRYAKLREKYLYGNPFFQLSLLLVTWMFKKRTNSKRDDVKIEAN